MLGHLAFADDQSRGSCILSCDGSNGHRCRGYTDGAETSRAVLLMACVLSWREAGYGWGRGTRSEPLEQHRSTTNGTKSILARPYPCLDKVIPAHKTICHRRLNAPATLPVGTYALNAHAVVE
jgi:hypothetical protein